MFLSRPASKAPEPFEKIGHGLDHASCCIKLKSFRHRQTAAKTKQKVTNTSVVPNYTIFQSDEDESEAALQVCHAVIQDNHGSGEHCFHNDLPESGRDFCECQRPASDLLVTCQ